MNSDQPSPSSAANAKRRRCHVVISSLNDRDSERGEDDDATGPTTSSSERFFEFATDGKIRVKRPRSTLTRSYEADSVAHFPRAGGGVGVDGAGDGDATLAELTELRESVRSGVASSLRARGNFLLWTFGPRGTGKTTAVFGEDGAGGLMSEVCAAVIGECFPASPPPCPRDGDAEERVVLSVSRLAFPADATDRAIDLLADADDGATVTGAPRVREAADGRFYVENCHDVVVGEGGELSIVLRLAHEEAARRADRDPTTFGRHHTLVTFTVTRRFANGDSLTSAVQVLDLCGAARGAGEQVGVSRRGKHSRAAPGVKASKARMEDRTLRAVHRVIDSLSGGGSHVPYRDSKVTRLTGRGLGGDDGAAVIFVPTGGYDEMCSALDFMEKVKSIAPTPAASSPDGGRGRRMNRRILLEQAEARVTALAARNGTDLEGLIATAIELDMDSPQDLVELRDALAAVVSLRIDPLDALVERSDAWWGGNADRVAGVRATVDSSDGG